MKFVRMYDANDLLKYEIKVDREEICDHPGEFYETRRVYFTEGFLKDVIVKETIHDDIEGFGEYFHVPNPFVPVEYSDEKYNMLDELFNGLPDALIAFKEGYGDIIGHRQGMFSSEMNSYVFCLLDRDIAKTKHEESMKEWGHLEIDPDGIKYIISVGFGFGSSFICGMITDEEAEKKIINEYYNGEKHSLDEWKNLSEDDRKDWIISEKYERRGFGNMEKSPVTFDTRTEVEAVRKEFKDTYSDKPAHDFTGTGWYLYSQKLIDQINHNIKYAKGA